MRRAFFVALGLLAIGGFTAEGASPHTRGTSQPVLRSLRVCTYEHFSIAGRTCTADQRRQPLLSTRIVCSISYSTPHPAFLSTSWTYEGHQESVSRRKVKGAGTYWISQDSGGPTMPLPGGKYECSFSLSSAHAHVALMSSGPTGDVVDLEICTVENAFKYNGFPVCKSDQTAVPISGGSAVVCNGTVPDASGKNVVVNFTSSDGTIVKQGASNTSYEPLEQYYASVSTDALRPGARYDCQFTFDGVVVAEKPFTVAPSGPLGSYGNTWPVGDAASAGDWTLRVNGPANFDAWAVLSQVDPANPRPPPGYVEVLANLTATYDGSGSGSLTDLEALLALRSASGFTNSPRYQSCGVAPHPNALDVGSLSTKQTATLNVCAMLPVGDVPVLELLAAGSTWFALR
jgi:hypothetical protein